MSGWNFFPHQCPPTWVNCAAGAFAYAWEILGVPTVLTVTEADMGPGRWFYEPNPQTILWKGDWNDGVNSGWWALAQQNDPLHDSFNDFFISLPILEIDFGISITSEGNTVSGDWPVSLATDRGMHHLNYIVPPWLFYITPVFYGMSYSELRAIGVDPNDTAPTTWNYVE